MGFTTGVYCHAVLQVHAGLISAYSMLFDPLVTSGLLNTSNVSYVNDPLLEGKFSSRIDTLSAEKAPMRTQNRAGWDEAVLTHYAAPSFRYWSSAKNAPTHGILINRQRLMDSIANNNPASFGHSFLLKQARESAMACYRAYRKEFYAALMGTLRTKVDLSSAETTTTFATDCPHTAYTILTNLKDPATTMEENA